MVILTMRPSINRREPESPLAWESFRGAQKAQKAERVSRTREKRRRIRRLTSLVVLGFLSAAMPVFLALPSTVTVFPAETNLSIARAEAMNVAMVNFIQSGGRSNAIEEWARVRGDQERYELLRPYLAFAPDEFEDYMPAEYALTLPETLQTLSKMPLARGGATISY